MGTFSLTNPSNPSSPLHPFHPFNPANPNSFLNHGNSKRNKEAQNDEPFSGVANDRNADSARVSDQAVNVKPCHVYDTMCIQQVQPMHHHLSSEANSDIGFVVIVVVCLGISIFIAHVLRLLS